MTKVNALSTMRVKAKVAAAVPGYSADGGGLYLQVSRSGTASWVFRYRFASRVREYGLGSTKHIGLADARGLAGELRKRVILGNDPVATRQATRSSARVATAKAMTFQACAELYIAAHRASWSNAKHAAQWGSTLATYAYPVMGGLPVAAIDTVEVMRAIETLWSSRMETASRVRGRIESVLDWAAVRGHRQGENPARWKGHLEHLLARKTSSVAHHAALPYAEIAGFMAELRTKTGVPARALEFAILTAARTGEAIGAKWDEINIAERLWVVPATRMKAGREHRVPLSDAAMAIVNAMIPLRQGAYVFSGARPGRPLSNMAMLAVLRRLGRTDLTAHGFRSSFSDWCAEQTSFPAEAREMALAHAIGSRVEASYRRGDMFQVRRRLADAWARWCAASVSPVVVELRA